jgi:hypothetical protein
MVAWVTFSKSTLAGGVRMEQPAAGNGPQETRQRPPAAVPPSAATSVNALFLCSLEQVHIQIPVCLDPVFVRFYRHGSQWSQPALLEREMSAPPVSGGGSLRCGASGTFVDVNCLRGPGKSL